MQKMYDPNWRMKAGAVWAYGLGTYQWQRRVSAANCPFVPDSLHARAWRQGWDDAK